MGNTPTRGKRERGEASGGVEGEKDGDDCARMRCVAWDDNGVAAGVRVGAVGGELGLGLGEKGGEGGRKRRSPPMSLSSSSITMNTENTAKTAGIMSRNVRRGLSREGRSPTRYGVEAEGKECERERDDCARTRGMIRKEEEANGVKGRGRGRGRGGERGEEGREEERRRRLPRKSLSLPTTSTASCDDLIPHATTTTTTTNANATCGMSRSERRGVSRIRLPPTRYVARPSKLGWGVIDGDIAFLSGGGHHQSGKDVISDNGGRGCNGCQDDCTRTRGVIREKEGASGAKGGVGGGNGEKGEDGREVERRRKLPPKSLSPSGTCARTRGMIRDIGGASGGEGAKGGVVGGSGVKGEEGPRKQRRPPMSLSPSRAVDSLPITSTASCDDQTPPVTTTTKTKNTKATEGMSRSERRGVRRIRLPPTRYVARPSKLGWGVIDGDVAFLSGEYHHGGSRRKDDITDKNDGGCSRCDGTTDAGDMTTNETNSTNGATATCATKISYSSSNGAAVRPVKGKSMSSKMKNTNTTSTDNAVAFRSVEAADVTSPSMSSSASPSAADGAVETMWDCHKCGHANLLSKKRCSTCQGWRGGMREGYSFSAIYAASSVKKKRKKKTKEDEAKKEKGGDDATDEEYAAASVKKKRKKEAKERTKEEVDLPLLWGGRQRRSALSRRPRILRPTEKAIAMMISSAKKTTTAISTTMADATTKRSRKTIDGKSSAAAASENKNRRAAVASATASCGKKTTPVSGISGINAHDDGITVTTRDDAARFPVMFDSNDNDDEDGVSNNEYDDVACCLCKCAVDFSESDFFVKPSNSGGNAEDDGKTPTGSIREGGDECTSRDGDAKSMRSNHKKDDDGNNGKKHNILLPYRLYDPGNALILCDGPAHARAGKRGNNGKGKSNEEYRCDRAYHQRCHFVPVLSIPRGPWRCLICKYRDEEYMKKQASRKVKARSSGNKSKEVTLSDSELGVIFRCVPIRPSMSSREVKWSAINRDWMEVVSKSDEESLPTAAEGCKNIPDAESSLSSTIAGIVTCNEESSRFTDISPDKANNNYNIAKLERRFEAFSAHMKAHLLHAELTSRSRGIIKSSLATIRTAEHSLRSITETSKARKALAERIESQELGLPQELCQSVMRIAASKTRVRELILNLEFVVRAIPQRHDVSNVIQLLNDHDSCTIKEEDEMARDINDGNTTYGCDPISEVMKWYLEKNWSGANANHEANVIASATATATATATAAAKMQDLLLYLFPEGTLKRRRHEPRTGEAHINTEARGGDDSSVTSISLDDLVCWNCHGSHATDENDMLLCDGIGCYRSFHMKCLEPHLSFGDVHKNTTGEEDDSWFCPLCTATANLTHFAQIEYLGDDYWDSPKKRKGSDDNINDEGGQKMKEWETATEVFPEATFELRVAQKLKDNVRDEETTTFLAQTLGIFTGSSLKDENSETSNDNHVLLSEEDESDDDFDHEEIELLDDESFAEDDDMERQLVKEKIGREELDALSVTSTDGSDSIGMDDNIIDSTKHRPRRSKRKKLTFSNNVDNGDEDTSSDTNSAVPPLNVGTVDTANILCGKRRRTQVDYRKLADVMFGDESDDEAKGATKEYKFMPKARRRRGRRIRQKNSDDDSSDDDEGDSSESDTNSDS